MLTLFVVGRRVKDPDKSANDRVLPKLYAKEEATFSPIGGSSTIPTF